MSSKTKVQLEATATPIHQQAGGLQCGAQCPSTPDIWRRSLSGCENISAFSKKSLKTPTFVGVFLGHSAYREDTGVSTLSAAPVASSSNTWFYRPRGRLFLLSTSSPLVLCCVPGLRT
jgi:hypothetical protein